MYELLGGHDGYVKLMTMSRVQAVFDEQSVRAPAGELECTISRRRAEYAKRPMLSCERKFRLQCIQHHDEDLMIELGSTDYFDYLATNHDAELNTALVEHGVAFYSDPDACLSNAIGNLAVVETVDGRIAALRRSVGVATFAGRVDLPGGHPEPAAIDSSLPRGLGLTTELFDAIRREVTEELGVSRSDLGEVALIGVIRSLEDGRKPEMIFHVPIQLSVSELFEAYATAPDRDESVSLLMGSSDELRQHGAVMTAPSHAALDLWDAQRSGARIA